MEKINIYSVDRFNRAVRYFLTGRAVQGISNLLYLLWVVRLLSVSDYGAFVTIIGTVELLIPLTSLGILEASRRYTPQLAGFFPSLVSFLRRMFVYRLLITAFLSFTIWYFWRPFTVRLDFSSQQIEMTNSVWLLAFLVLNFRYIAEVLEALLEQKKSQFVRVMLILGKLVGIGINLIFVEELTLKQLLTVEITVTFLCTAVSAYLLYFSLLEVARKSTVRSAEPVKWITFAKHMTVVSLANACISGGALRILVASTLGLNDAALFGFLQSLQQMAWRYLPANLLQSLVRPMLIHRYTGPDGHFILCGGGNLLWKSNLLLLGGLTVLLIFSGNAIISLASGGRFENAGPPAIILLCVLFASASRSILEMVVQITGNTAVLQNVSLLSPFILLLVWFSSDYGLVFMIGSLFLGLITWNIITLHLLGRQNFPFHFSWEEGIKIILSLLVSILTASLLVFVGNVENSVLLITISWVIYLLLLAFLKPFSQRELALVEVGTGKHITKYFRLFVKP